MPFCAISIFFLFAGLSTVVAQGSTSVTNCTSALWTVNDHGQNPCLVASGLRQACTGGSSNLPPLANSNSGYLGPKSPAESSGCACSSVTYSMVAACGLCQGGGFVIWNEWIQNCSSSDIKVSSYPRAIPSGIAVPAWAYDNVTVLGTFNTGQAEAEAESHSRPDVTGTQTPSPLPSPTSDSGGEHPHKKTNVGAIAGGVVGGVVGALLLTLLAIIFLRRRNSHERMSNDYAGSSDIIKTLEARADTPPAPPPMAYVTPLKLYDPSDPSTYPPELSFNPNHLPTDSTTSAGLTSPTTNVFSPTSTTSLDPSYTHARNFSGGTTVSSSSISNVNLHDATSPAMHGRNISADSAKTGHGAPTFSSTLTTVPTVGHSGAVPPPGAGYFGAPEI